MYRRDTHILNTSTMAVFILEEERHCHHILNTSTMAVFRDTALHIQPWLRYLNHVLAVSLL